MIRSTLTKEIGFDAGHRVPLHSSKCRNPHGHRYRVVVTASGPVPGDGMVVDFGVLKEWMTTDIHDVLDHAFICQDTDYEVVDNWLPQWRLVVVPYAPTAENLAFWCFQQLAARADGSGLSIDAVTVWETPTSSATYAVEPT